MCLAPRLLSPTAGVSYDGLFMWLKGSEVGPPNLLQVEEQGEKILKRMWGQEGPRLSFNLVKEKVEKNAPKSWMKRDELAFKCLYKNMSDHFALPPGVHRHQLLEHGLLLSEGSERSPSELTDRHLRHQLWNQPAHTQSRLPGQDFLW